MERVEEELDSAFVKLVGRQPTDQERLKLYHVKDALQLSPDDSLWIVLIVLEHYSTLYETIPNKINKIVERVEGLQDQQHTKTGYFLFSLFLGSVLRLIWHVYVSPSTMQSIDSYWVIALCLINMVFQMILFYKKTNHLFCLF